MNIEMIKVPCIKGRYESFKVKSKDDARIFIEKALGNGEYVIPISRTEIYVIEKKDDEISITTKCGDLHDIFNPMLEVANTNNSAYKDSVYDVVYKIRKYVNAKWFNEER